MNAPANISTRAVYLSKWRADLLSLSQTQRRLAHEYKRWALAEEAAGDWPRYRKFKAESNRLWNEAKWHLQAARRAA